MTLRSIRKTFLAGLFLVFSLSSLTRGAELPNIVVVLADDLGWGDPQCYQAESKIPTPSMNRLAREGLRFTDAHTPSSVCTPTRYGLLTGRYCWRTRLKSGVLDGFDPPLINDDQDTIARLLKRAGYGTHCIGKWHLGLRWKNKDGTQVSDRDPANGFRTGELVDFSKPFEGGPLQVGFDSFFGISASLDMSPYCYLRDDRVVAIPTRRSAEDKDGLFMNQVPGVITEDFDLVDVLPRIGREAAEVILDAATRDEPFFCYVPLTSPHLPVVPTPESTGKSKAGSYGDFVVATDNALNAILQALDDSNVAENTIVIFTSDNGGLFHWWDFRADDDGGRIPVSKRGRHLREFEHRSNAHWRGTKADIHEGGHRVPFLLRWPSRVDGGQVVEQVIELTDVYATIADIVGESGVNAEDTPGGQDSISFKPLLTRADRSEAISRPFSIHHSLKGMFAIRQGPWKLVDGRGSGGFTRPRSIESTEPAGQLYHLLDDPRETKNVYVDHPDVVARLRTELNRTRSSEVTHASERGREHSVKEDHVHFQSQTLPDSNLYGNVVDQKTVQPDQAHQNPDDKHRSFDVVVYGATPGGIAAAVAIARREATASVALVSPFKRVGGLITNGLTHPDFRTFEGRTGLFREFNRRVLTVYQERFGVDSPQVEDCLFGTHAGPEVNYTVLRQMIDELPGITVLTRHRLKSVLRDGSRIRAVTLDAPDGAISLLGDYFVDATYEGDLMAAAGTPFHVGREGQETFHESLAPPKADDQLQGYNFRLTMTDVPKNRVAVPKPQGYDRSDYLPLLELLEDGTVKRIFGDPYLNLHGGIYKRQTPKLPNGKRDINDVSHSIVRLSLPHLNNDWPEGDEATRQRIFDVHVRHNVGMLYFLQHDQAVPEKFQREAQSWGLCRDELKYNNHLPEQLYVREGRRMMGRYVFTQRDTEPAANTNHARAVFQPDAVAMGDYGPNCHGTDHEGPTIGGRHTGEFYQRAAPYQIPYGTILPGNGKRETIQHIGDKADSLGGIGDGPGQIDNLAVPVACSSSHVGFCALRLEPIWMSLGQAAGEAIGLALESGAALDKVKPASIRARLHETGTATIYTSDVPEESDDFVAVQWWGSLGGFIALDRTMDDEKVQYGRRGNHRIGQYHEAFPYHAVGLDQPMTPPVRSAWEAIAKSMMLRPEEFKSALTRGDFIRVAFSQYMEHFQP